MRLICILIALMAFATEAFCQSPPVWEEGPPLLTPRMFHCATTYGDAIYVFGGIDDHRQLLGSVEFLRAGSAVWEEGPEMPTALYNTAVVPLARQLMLIGGSNQERASSDVVLFLEPNRGQYSRGPALPQPRSGMAATVEGGCSVLVMGGIANRGMPEMTGFRLVLPPEGRWDCNVPSLNSRRINFGLIWNQTAFAVGGIHYGPVNSIEVLTRNGWQNLSRLPVPRGELGVITYERCIICVGGRDREGRAVAQVDAYDIDHLVWSSLPPLQMPRAGLTTVLFNGTLYAIGGITSPQFRETVLNTVEMLRLRPDTVSVPVRVEPAPPAIPLSFYPNPANGMVRFNLPGFRDGWMRLFDPRGRRVTEQPISSASGAWVWDASQTPTGDYFLVLLDDKGAPLAGSRLTVLK